MSNSQIMLSIVIPYFKFNFFETTLDSLSNQTDKRFKVFIGNDNSPDDPTNLLKNYKDKFDFVYHKFEKNLGSVSLTKQWERCISLSQSEEWIMILGDDDILEKNVVEEFYISLDKVNSNKINVIRYASVLINNDKLVESSVFIHEEKEIMLDFYSKKLTDITRSSLSEYVFRKTIYEEYKFKNYPLGWHSDDMAWFEFSEGKEIFSINQAKVFIRIFQDSVSGNSSNIFLKDSASIQFYNDLLKRKDVLKNGFVREILLKRLEVLYKKRLVINRRNWFYFLVIRLKNLDFYNSIKLIRRIIIFSINK